MTTKRGKVPSLITGSSGKPSMVTAKRKRTCYRCDVYIEGGLKCFEIPKLGGGFSTKKTCCKNCFQEILDQTKKDLEDLEEILCEC